MPRRRTLLAAAALLLTGTAANAADPGYYVVTVYDDPGLRSVDFRYWSVKRPGRPEATWPELGLGWNVNGRWYTEILASWMGRSGKATRLSTLSWQNDLLLTRGQYPFDLAVHTLLSRAQDEPRETALELGPVLQTDVGRTQLNANVFFERSWGGRAPKPTQMKYQWQVRHRWKRGFHVGAQGFGELGQWDHWAERDDQSHRAGPALFGAIPVGADSLAWQAAWLSGSTYGKHGRMLSLRVKYDF